MSYPASIALKTPHQRVATFTGIGGSFAVEWVAAFAWIRWQRWPGIRTAILAHQNGEMPAKDLWQRFGGEIDAFYAQLKLEVDKGWIQEPEMAKLRQLETA